MLEKHVLFKKSFENELGFQNKNYDNLKTHVLRLLVCMASGCALSAERWVRKADGQTRIKVRWSLWVYNPIDNKTYIFIDI